MKHNRALINRLKAKGEAKASLLSVALDRYLYHREARAIYNQTIDHWADFQEGISTTYRYRTRHENGETWCEYRLLPPMSIEDIEDMKNWEWICINSPYDCTGRAFTQSIHTHINPSGMVSWIRYKGLDI